MKPRSDNDSLRSRSRSQLHFAAPRLLAGVVLVMLASCDQTDQSPAGPADSPPPSAKSSTDPSSPSPDKNVESFVTRTAPGGPRLVLLYATCTVNKNFLSPYNSEIGFTPHLDDFAKKSVVFKRHQTEAGQSGVAYASLFTGTQAERHGVYYHPTRLSDDLYVISEAFADAGYEPFFWSGHGLAASDLAYGQGVPPENVVEMMLLRVDPRFQQILKRLKRDPEYKAFVMTNFSVTHSHYNFRPAVLPTFLEKYPDALGDLPPDQFETYRQLFLNNVFAMSFDFQKLVEANQLNQVDIDKLSRTIEVMYRACVHSLDELFGGVVAEVESHDLLDDSLIAFTADHGELLYRENAMFPWTHGYQLAPEVLSVPFLLSAVGELEPGTCDGVTRSIDVFPTLAGLCNLKLSDEPGISGVDLSPQLRAQTKDTDLLAYSHTSMRNPIGLKESGDRYFDRFYPTADPDLMWVCIRDGDMVYKYRSIDGTAWGHEVFDLAADPEESHNLYDTSIREHREFAQRLLDYKARLAAAFRTPPPVTRSRKNVLRKRLKSLGYVE